MRGRSAAMALLALIAAIPAVAGSPDAGRGPIEDNSFLVEEAYNQEARVVQHIATWSHSREGGAWEASFTQEWPAGSRRHQVSVTIPLQRLANGGAVGIGDVALNYRYMGLGVEGGRVAFAPRLSALLPTGDFDRGLGAAEVGIQANLPLSTTLAPRLVAHSNAGATYVGAGGGSAAIRGFNLGQSLIWLAAPRINLMMELAWERSDSPGVAGDADLEERLLLAPGVRWSHDFPSGLQVVPGIAAPIGIGPSRGERAILLYLSVEHGF